MAPAALQEDRTDATLLDRVLGAAVGRLRRMADEPRQIIAMLRTRQAADASMRCFTVGLQAFGFIFAWSLIASIAMAVILVPVSMIAKAPIGNHPLAIAVLIPLVLPGAIAVVIALVAPLAGVLFGLIGLFQSGDRLLGAAGVGLNILLLAAFAVLVIGTIGLSG